MSDESLKIAVFIDFDNIEIGVKSTLGREFEVGAVLDALKERGEVITKVAYGDWKKAGDYSRMLTQHAVRMVQRNMTPGGDKNGADINLALDALEMALTHDHINAYVIVGGDSDFISLVEKLKQYDISQGLTDEPARFIQRAPLGTVRNPYIAVKIIFALLCGTIIGAGLAMLMDCFDTTLKTESDVEQTLALSVLASVPAVCIVQPAVAPTDDAEVMVALQ